jgi:hypothetical protein
MKKVLQARVAEELWERFHRHREERSIAECLEEMIETWLGDQGTAGDYVPRGTDEQGVLLSNEDLNWLTMASGGKGFPGSLSSLRSYVGQLDDRVTALEEGSREEGVQPVEGGEDSGMIDQQVDASVRAIKDLADTMTEDREVN